MVSAKSSIYYDVASLICALFVLEKGADIFVDHTVIVARKTGIPQSAIALLTAGAEWEELAVVVACIAKGRPSLAIGNVVGSSIANILGAFSLGLIFYDRRSGSTESPRFESSSIIYTLTLLVVTTAVTCYLAFGGHVQPKPIGGVFIALFGIYVLSISYLISKGITRAPELSDSDSDSDSASDTTSTSGHGGAEEGRAHNEVQGYGSTVMPGNESTPILRRPTSLRSANLRKLDEANRPKSRHLLRHFSLLLLGLMGIIVSGYVLSEAVANLADKTGISDGLAGVVILSIATTIPEKLVAVLSGFKGHGDIMLANTVGSNTFLLTLCIGLVWAVSGSAETDIASTEIWVMFASALLLAATVFIPFRFYPFMGFIMLAGYFAFIVLEFTVIHRV